MEPSGRQDRRESRTRKVECTICGSSIGSRRNLFVASRWGIGVKPYCRRCYADKEKTFLHHGRTGSFPLNSEKAHLRVVIGLLAAPLLIPILLVAEGGGIVVAVLYAVIQGWMVALRVLSYTRYESRIPR